MGKNTEIKWTDHTWNPWQGCKKVSPGCKNCYMFRDKKRWGQDGSNIHRSGNVTFFNPLSWKEPAKVFTCSWSDFFLEEADLWRDDAWKIIKSTPHLTYQILTKRPENMIDRLPDDWPLPNVWLGVTAENQEEAARRIPYLLMHEPGDAVVKFVSVEPMLEEIDLTEIHATNDPAVSFNLLTGIPYDWNTNNFDKDNSIKKIDWVICGGESGSNFREMKKEWAWDLLQQTEIPGTPFFMKQMAGKRPKNIPIPDVLKVKEFPK